MFKAEHLRRRGEILNGMPSGRDEDVSLALINCAAGDAYSGSPSTLAMLPTCINESHCLPDLSSRDDLCQH